MKWTQQQAVEVCRQVEEICPQYNCHVALTGGCLYKDGERKDLDLVFYRVRGKQIDVTALLSALYHQLGLRTRLNAYWCQKLEFAEHWPWAGGKIDAFFPELFGDEYPSEDEVKKMALELEQENRT